MKRLLNALCESFIKNLDFMMKVVTIFGAIFTGVSVIILLLTDIDKKLEEKIKNHDVIRKIAAEIKSPFIIFNSEGKVLYEDNGSELIDLEKIVCDYDDEYVKVIGITITTKRFLKYPPILSSIDGEEYFHEATRIDTFKWYYKTIELDRIYWSLPNGKMPVGRYKLEIIR